jgi:FK506-binding protein 4/5
VECNGRVDVYEENWDNVLSLTLTRDFILEGLEETLFKMKRKEHSLIEFCEEHEMLALKELDSESVEGEKKKVFCEVLLHDFVMNKHQWELNQEEKYEFAAHRKEQGNRYFSIGILERAVEMWEQALEFIHYETSWKDELVKEKYTLLKIACHNNIAGVYASLKKHQEVINHTTEVLNSQPQNLKALFRRARAYCYLKDPEAALKDIDTVFKSELSDSEKNMAEGIITAAKSITSKSRHENKRMFGGIFDR